MIPLLYPLRKQEEKEQEKVKEKKKKEQSSRNASYEMLPENKPDEPGMGGRVKQIELLLPLSSIRKASPEQEKDPTAQLTTPKEFTVRCLLLSLTTSSSFFLLPRLLLSSP